MATRRCTSTRAAARPAQPRRRRAAAATTPRRPRGARPPVFRIAEIRLASRVTRVASRANAAPSLASRVDATATARDTTRVIRSPGSAKERARTTTSAPTLVRCATWSAAYASTAFETHTAARAKSASWATAWTANASATEARRDARCLKTTFRDRRARLRKTEASDPPLDHRRRRTCCQTAFRRPPQKRRAGARQSAGETHR